MVDIENKKFSKFIRLKELPIFLLLSIALFNLCGWIFGKPYFTSFSDNFHPASIFSNVFFIVLSVITILRIKGIKAIAFKIALLTIILIAILVFLRFYVKSLWDLENIFHTDPKIVHGIPIGRMSPITALLFIFTSIGVWGYISNISKTFKYVGGISALFVIIVSSVIFIGYLYKVPFFYGSSIKAVSLPSTINFLLCSSTLLRLYEKKYWAFYIKENYIHKKLLKSFIPIVIAIVVVQGFLITNFSIHFNNPALSSAIVLLAVIITTIVVIARESNLISTKILKAENALRISEERYKRITNAITDYLYSVIVVNGRPVKTIHSEACFAITGYTVKEFQNDPHLWINMVVPEERELIAKRLLRMLEGEDLSQIEHRIICKNRNIKWIHDTLIPKYNEAGELLSYDGIIKDITERKEAECQLISKTQEIEAQNEEYLQINEELNQINNELYEAKKLVDESETKFKVAFLTSPDSVNINTLDGEYVEINEGYTLLTGYTREDVIGAKSTEIGIWTILEHRQLLVDTLKAKGKIENLESVFRCKDGSLKTALMSASLIYLKGVPNILSVTRDITFRKNIEIELKKAKELAEENENKYKLIFENTNTANSIFNKECILTIQNQYSKTLLGLKEKNGIGMSVFEIFGKEKGTIVFERMNRIFQTGIPEEFETEFELNGHKKWFRSVYKPIFDVENRVVSLQIISQDITEIKKSEHDVIKFQKAIEYAKACIIITNTEGNIEYANPYFTELSGYKPEEYLGKRPNILKTNIKDKAFYDNLWQTIKNGKTWEGEFCNRKKNGELYWESAIISPIVNSTGKITNFVAVKTDITEKKKLNTQLLEAKHLVEENSILNSTLLQTIPFGIDIVDKDGLILYQSENLKKIFGNESLNKKCWELLRDDKTQCGNCPLHAKIKLGVTETCEISGIMGDRVFESVHTGMLFHGEHAMLEILIDITERKHAEIELIKAKIHTEENERKYKILFETLTEGVALNEIMYDENGEMVDYRIAEVNNAFYNLADFKTDNVIGKTATDVYGMSTDTIKSFWLNHKDKVETIYTEMVSPLSNKCFFIATSPFVNDTFVTSFFDITNLKQSQQKLEEKNEQLVLALQNVEESELKYRKAKIDLDKAQTVAKIGSWKWFIQENKLSWSHEMYSIFGITEQEFTGNLTEVIQHAIHPDDREIVEQSNLNVIENGLHIPLEYRIVLKDGAVKTVWAEAGELVNDKNSKPLILTGIVQDITERKKAEAELIAAKEKAEESDRLKTAFLQNMSHEIRTPMNAIMGFSELMIKNFDDKKQLEKFAEIISHRSNDLLHIINDILEIAKIESGQLPVSIEKVFVNEIIKEIVFSFKAEQIQLNKEHIELRIKTPSHIPNVTYFTDKIKLKQILINLIGNAFKFTDSGTIEVGYAVNENKVLQFYVSDTGIGIPDNKQTFIFERFAQIDNGKSRVYSGNGLGLSIVKGLIDLLGGKIWLESKLDKGTTFYFTIPNNETKSVSSQKSPIETKDNYDFKGKTILIVEDDVYNAELFIELLTETGFTILHTRYGNEAIKICLNQHVDIVLMDISLPDIDGHEATRKIRESKPDLKIIAQTGFAANDDKRKALEAGCNDYISKPINRDLLFTIIQKQLFKIVTPLLK